VEGGHYGGGWSGTDGLVYMEECLHGKKVQGGSEDVRDGASRKMNFGKNAAISQGTVRRSIS